MTRTTRARFIFHSRHVNTAFRSALFVCIGLWISGCETLNYYYQATSGHLAIMNNRQAITDVIEDSSTPLEYRQKLKRFIQARTFAAKSLHLPTANHYLQYSHLDRDYVTWNVVATQPLSLDPVQSCFPIIGCLSYRGYFDKVNAKQYAQKLKDKGLETTIAGSTAYSTLGWFDDPVTNIMLKYGQFHPYETLFHELAHQKFYLKNDTELNEAFATFMGQHGMRQWLIKSGKKQPLKAYEQYVRERRRFIQLLSDTSSQLKQIYANPSLSIANKYKQKKQIFNKLRTDFQVLYENKQLQGYKHWFDKEVNNPRLSLVSTYHEWVDQFERIFNSCGRDYEQFYSLLNRLHPMRSEARKDWLRQSKNCQ